MNTTIGNLLYAKRIIYLLENEIGTLQERTNWVQDLFCIIPPSFLREIDNWDNVQTFCTEYNIEIEEGPRPSDEQKTKNVRENTQGDNITMKFIKHQYQDIITHLTTAPIDKQKYYQHFEDLAAIMILDKDFKKISEVEYRIDSHLNDPTTSRRDTGSNTIQPKELASLRRTKIFISMALFLQERYFDCSQKLFQFITSDIGILDESLWNSSYNLINKDEFHMMSTISMLLAIPLDKCQTFIQLPDVIEFFKVFPPAKTLFNLLNNTKFRRFFNQWTTILNSIGSRSPLLAPKLKEIEEAMRVKIYIFYLSISTRIPISYLSDTLGIPYKDVEKDIKGLLQRRKINFELVDGLLCYKERSILTDVIDLLKTNDKYIDELLMKQRRINCEMKDSIQAFIINNNKNQETKTNSTFDNDNGKRG